MIPTTTPPFGLGYKHTKDDLLEMEVRKMARAKAKAKGLPCLLEPLKPYTPTLNGKFEKVGESQRYWGFLEPRFDLVTRTMVPGFEILLDYNNKVPKLKKEDTTWVPINWADYMDPDAMATLFGDPICNIEEEEEYWEACQHALKSSYKLRANDKDEEEGVAPSDDEDGSDYKRDSSSDSSSSDSGHNDDDSSTNSESNNNEDYDSQYSGND